MLATNYQNMIKEHGKVAEARFPHTAYGQDKNSETFKKSFPQSYKRYFFKLVKNVILTKAGKKKINRNYVAMVMTNGTRQNQVNDPMVMKSQNTRL